jgi:hypothetical protein
MYKAKNMETVFISPCTVSATSYTVFFGWGLSNWKWYLSIQCITGLLLMVLTHTEQNVSQEVG